MNCDLCRVGLKVFCACASVGRNTGRNTEHKPSTNSFTTRIIPYVSSIVVGGLHHVLLGSNVKLPSYMYAEHKRQKSKL